MCHNKKKFLMLLAPKLMKPNKHDLRYDELLHWVGMNASLPWNVFIYKNYNTLFL